MKPTRTRPPRRPTFESAHDATPRMVKIRLKIKPLRAQVPSSIQIIHTGTEQNRKISANTEKRHQKEPGISAGEQREHAERGGVNSKTGSRRRNSPPLAGGRAVADRRWQRREGGFGRRPGASAKGGQARCPGQRWDGERRGEEGREGRWQQLNREEMEAGRCRSPGGARFYFYFYQTITWSGLGSSRTCGVRCSTAPESFSAFVSLSVCFFLPSLCPMNTFSRAVGWHVRTPFSSNFYLLRIILWHGNFLVAVGPWKKILFFLEIELCCCVFRHRWFGLVW